MRLLLGDTFGLSNDGILISDLTTPLNSGEVWVVCHLCLISPYFYSLRNKLSGEEAQRIQLQDIREPEYHFLDADCLQLGQAFADSIRAADQRACCNWAAQESSGDFCPRLLIVLTDSADARYCAVDALVIASDGRAVFFEHGELLLDGLQIAVDITGIAILRDQFERHFLATAANQQGDMRFLHTFGLVDGTAYLVKVAFKDRFFLGPHSQNHLHRFAQAAQAVRSIGIIIAVGAVFVLEPTGAYAEIEPPVREHIDCAGHLREQGRVTIPVARDRLTNAHRLRITRQRRCGGPTLERYFLRWARNGMELIDQPDRGETRLVGCLGHTRHRLVGFNRVLDACQIHCPALRQGQTKFQRHEQLPLFKKSGRASFFLIGAIPHDICRYHLDAGAPLEYTLFVIPVPGFLDHRSLTTRIRSS